MNASGESHDSGLERVLSRLEGVCEAGGGWKACCPAHQDNSPSLSVNLSDDESRILVKCHAGCETLSVLDAAGLVWEDLFLKDSPGPRPDSEPPTLTNQEADYRDRVYRHLLSRLTLL